MSDCPAGEQYLVGQLGRFADATGSTTLCYNRFGDLVRKVQRAGASSLTVRWVYEASGRLQKMMYPGGVEVDYVRDAQGRIAEIGVTRNGSRQVLLSGASYHPFGPVKRWSFGNGLELRRALDLDGRPMAVEDGPVNGTGPGIALRYTYDDAGRLSRLRSGHGAASVEQAYTYDGLDRLFEVKDAAGLVLERYTYDRTGDRLTAGEWVASGVSGGPGGGTPTYTFQTLSYGYAPDSHRLTSVGDEPRQYDAVGNLVSMGDPNAPGGPRRQFSYNDAERLSTVTSTAPIATYGYNALGERIRKTAYGINTYTIYDTDGHWLGDFNGTGSLERIAIWLDDLPVGLVVGTGSAQSLYYVEADALGSPRAVIDPVRNLAVWRWEALGDAYGHDYPEEDPDGDGAVFNLDMRFPGQQFDAVSGLHYNGFRDFDPTTGRYVESDPIGLAAGPSTYGYANGSPMMHSDPDGLYIQFGARLAMRFILPRLGIRVGLGFAARSAALAARRETFAQFARRLAQRQAERIARATQSIACGGGKRAVVPGEAGRFADLAKRGVKGDKLTPHHMPQVAANFTSRADGGALMMTEAEHVLTRTYGYAGSITAKQEAGMAFRDVLARDLRDVRRIVGGRYNSGMLDLIEYYRVNFPWLMAKP